MFSLNGKLALVTGASGGIGGAISKALYDAGASVVLNGRDISKLDNMKSKILNGSRNDCDNDIHKNKNQLHSVPLNLMDIDAVSRLIKQSYDITGKTIDILVNAAGVHELRSFPRISAEQMSNIMELNFRIPFKLCQAVIKPMLNNKFGRVINVTSDSAHGAAGQAHYDSSKGALTSLTKSLAANTGYVQYGLTFNCIAPGIIETDMSIACKKLAKDSLLNQIPMRRFGSAEEVAGAAVFLASNAATYINGQIISINGGMVR